MEITRKIVKQPFAPDTTDVLWLDSSGDSDVLKSFCNGQWKETSTPQQDYKVIAPKQGRDIISDAAALGELKKAILNGIGFDCIIKDTVGGDGDFNRVLGFYPDGSLVNIWSTANLEAFPPIEMLYTVTQYQGLAAVQQALDEKYGLQEGMTYLTTSGATSYLQEDSAGRYICVDNKYLIVTGDETVTTLTIAETGPGQGDDFVNITWEDAQKLIGLPLT